MGRFFRRLFQIVLAFVLLLAAGTLVPRPLVPAPDAGPVEHRILVLGNPIHTDIAIPLDADVLARFAPLVAAGIKADLPGAHYLVFGWGSRAFYIETPTWAELKPGPLLSALTLDNSVMHVSVAGDLDEADASIRSFGIGDAEFERLLAFIEASFAGEPHAPAIIDGASYGEFDGFFEAEGHFTAALGCNTWTAAALREAGLRTGWWNPLPQTLGLSLDLYN